MLGLGLSCSSRNPDKALPGKKKKEEKKHIGSDIIPAATYSSEKHRGYTGGKKETENSAERSRF